MRSLVVSLTILSNGKALLKAKDVRPTDTDTKMAHHSDPMNHRQVLSDLHLQRNRAIWFHALCHKARFFQQRIFYS